MQFKNIYFLSREDEYPNNAGMVSLKEFTYSFKSFLLRLPVGAESKFEATGGVFSVF